MGIAITEEHLSLENVAREFLEKNHSRGEARALLDSTNTELPALWGPAAELGWLGLHLPESVGGSGYGLLEAGIILEQIGAQVTPGPFLGTIAASALINRAASSDLAARLLPGLADGSVPAAIGLGGSLAIKGDVVQGDAGLVLGASMAKLFVLVAGDDVVLVDADAAGVHVQPEESLDMTRAVGAIRCESVSVDKQRVLQGAALLARQLAVILAAAEASGGAAACVREAVAYAQVRQQFGRVIGSFQAVKHHCVNMLAASELATATAWDALRAADESGTAPRGDTLALAAATAGAIAPPAFLQCARTNIQVHGGIGFTWEHDAHIFLRRSLTLLAIFGSSDRHSREICDLTISGMRRKPHLDLPEDAERFRGEVREFNTTHRSVAEKDMRLSLAHSGYLMPHWPQPYGRGAGAVEQLVIDEELEAERPFLGLASWILPTIIYYGTQEQKDRWIMPALEGNTTWCQLFSEPEAGSDLAAVRTRAERADGGWLINGQKVWTSGAQLSDWGLCLARTDPDLPKHKGIGCFVIDMKAPGVEVRPLRELTGETMFNEVFFNDLFVPDDHLIGEPTAGWYAARATLANERITIGSSGGTATEVTMHDLAERFGSVAAEDPVAATQIGALLAESQAISMLGLRTAARAVSGGGMGFEGTISKLLGGEHDQRLTELGMKLLGASGALMGEASDPWIHAFLYTRCLTIAGGTSEVLRSLIGEMALGLPREPKAPTT